MSSYTINPPPHGCCLPEQSGKEGGGCTCPSVSLWVTFFSVMVFFLLILLQAAFLLYFLFPFGCLQCQCVVCVERRCINEWRFPKIRGFEFGDIEMGKGGCVV